jgi:hypothetical protein
VPGGKELMGGREGGASVSVQLLAKTEKMASGDLRFDMRDRLSL